MSPVSRAKAADPEALTRSQNASFLYSVSCRKGGGSNLGAWEGLRNRWLSTGLLSHFVHRMDSFLGKKKNPSFCTEGGYCLWTSASFVTEAERCVDVNRLSMGLTSESIQRGTLAFLSINSLCGCHCFSYSVLVTAS